MPYLLFEDQQYVNFLPLAYFRPVWELRCGAKTLAEKWQETCRGEIYYSARNYLKNNYLQEERTLDVLDKTEEATWLNGRWLFDSTAATELSSLTSREALARGENLLAFKASPKEIAAFLDRGVLAADKVLAARKKREIPARVASFPWDLIEWNGAEIEADFKRCRPEKVGSKDHPMMTYLVNPEKICLSSGVSLEPGVVLDASEGPVWIDSGAQIMAQTVIKGPAYIGRDTQIKVGAKIYPDTSIGPVCKIGGEVEGSIIQGYANKQHDGFLGHAYLGAWVNLGADTNNSDLKNNYGEIRVLLNGRELNTGRQFLGLMMGDHSKCAINTMFNTGTIVGVNCNIFGEGMPPKFVPSFSWGGAQGLATYNLEKAMAVAETVMNRRKIPFTSKYKKMFLEVKSLAEELELREN